MINEAIMFVLFVFDFIVYIPRDVESVRMIRPRGPEINNTIVIIKRRVIFERVL